MMFLSRSFKHFTSSSPRGLQSALLSLKTKNYLRNDKLPMKVCVAGISQSPTNYKYEDERHLTEEDKKSVFYLFKPDIGFGVNFMAFLHKKKDFSWSGMKKWYHNLKERAKIHDQRFIPERHRILGPDLATAHFIVHRHGAIKFKGYKNWIKMDAENEYNLPNKNVPNLYLEAIDASGTNLLYEGFDNLINLYHLKHLNLSKCAYIDDWCLDRLTTFKETLEYLDISGCEKITERGVLSLHRLSNLRYLNLANLPNFHNKELVCLLLEDLLPNCRIVGVEYLNPNAAEGKESSELMEKMAS